MPRFAFVALCAALLACGASASRRVTFISDIHYDPLYGTAKAYGCTSSSSPIWGTPGCDASPQLTARALDDVSAHNTSFILYSGDWQRHHYADSGLAPPALFADLSARFRNVTVDGSLGAVAFSGSLGNNDVVPDYYFSWDSEATERELRYRVDAMKSADLLDDDEAEVMAQCGYYTHVLPTVHVIVLHTLLWAYRLEPSLPSSVTDPCNQFEFLRDELAKVQRTGKRAIIMGHIPPGLNTYNVLENGFETATKDMFWKEAYEAKYDGIIAQYRDVVAVQLFGHTHKFTLLTMSRNGALSLIVPSISPIFSNNPSYLLANFSDAWALQDVQIRYATDGGAFHTGGSAAAALNVSTGLYDFSAVRAAIAGMATNDVTWEAFMMLFCGGEGRLAVLPNGVCGQRCRYTVICSMLENNLTAIQSCVAQYVAGDNNGAAPSADLSTSPGVTAAIVLLTLVAVGAAAMLLLMSRSGLTSPTLAELATVAWWKSLLRRDERVVISSVDDATAMEVRPAKPQPPPAHEPARREG